jgi:hypothetical protein
MEKNVDLDEIPNLLVPIIKLVLFGELLVVLNRKRSIAQTIKILAMSLQISIPKEFMNG